MPKADSIPKPSDISRDDILRWLREDDEGRLEHLWRMADETRRRCVGEEVHLRALIEISNHCRRRCAYCGLNADNENIDLDIE